MRTSPVEANVERPCTQTIFVNFFYVLINVVTKIHYGIRQFHLYYFFLFNAFAYQGLTMLIKSPAILFSYILPIYMLTKLGHHFISIM